MKKIVRSPVFKNSLKFILDCMLCFVPLGLFLFEYQTLNDDGLKGSGTFIYLVTIIVCSLSGFKLITEIMINFFSKLQSKYKSFFISAISLTRGMIFGAVLFLLWVYLFVVIVGLYYWGSVPAIDIILYYGNHLNQFYGLYWLNEERTYQILFGFWLIISILYLIIESFLNWQKSVVSTLSNKSQLGLFLGLNLLLILSIMPFLSFNLESFSVTITRERIGQDLATDTKDNLEGHRFNVSLAKSIDKQNQKIRDEKLKNISDNNTHPNVVLIVVDALRYDHMQVYGYKRPTTPNLEKLQENGQVRLVNNVHSTCSDTACGILGIVSSRFVPQFSYNPITLHEILKDNHYVENLILSGDHTFFYDLKRYYGNVDHYLDGTTPPKGQFGFNLNSNFLNNDQKVIDDLKNMPEWNKKSTFFQFHLMSAHVLRPTQYYSGLYSPYLNYMLPYNRDPDNQQAWYNFYDNGVWHADDFIHQILDLLKEKGYLNNTVVVITGDHGDGMGEHGYFTHANSIYEEATRIPLIFIDFHHQPQFTQQKNPVPGQVDIAPTILQELGLEQDIPSVWAGKPLGGTEQNNLLFFEERKDSGLIDKKSFPDIWKYWYNSANKKEWAFDLQKDPQERDNKIAEVPKEIRQQWKACILSKTNQPLLKNCHL